MATPVVTAKNAEHQHGQQRAPPASAAATRAQAGQHAERDVGREPVRVAGAGNALRCPRENAGDSTANPTQHEAERVDDPVPGRPAGRAGRRRVGGERRGQQPAGTRRSSRRAHAMVRAAAGRPVPTKVDAGNRPRFADIDRRPKRPAGRRRHAGAHDRRRAPEQAVRRPPRRRRRVVHLRAGHGDRLPRPERRRQVHHHADDLRAHPAHAPAPPPSAASATAELRNPGRRIGVLLDAVRPARRPHRPRGARPSPR